MVKHLCAAGFASTKRLTFVICLALGCSALSQAAVIYDNGPVNLAQLSRFSDEVPDGSFPATRVADNFVLQTGANVIGHVQWWGTYSPNTPLPLDNFFIRIYTNAGGLPGVLHTQVSVAPSRVD